MPHAESPPPTEPPTIDGVSLHVNDGPLPPESVVKMTVSHIDDPIEVLRQRYNTDGYILVKGILPREDVLAAREAYFKSMEPSGVLRPGTKPVEGIFDSEHALPSDYPGIGAGSDKNAPIGDTVKAQMFVDLALKAHTEEWYSGSEDGKVTGFANHPKLKQFISRFTEWGPDTLSVKRSLLRNNTPGSSRATGVHYDQIFMRHGEPTSMTAWVPMGDVSIEGGGLIYLEDGNSLGKEIEDDFAAKAKAAGLSEEETLSAFNNNMMSSGFLCDGPLDFGKKYGKKWHVGAYEAGDVVFHTPHMIHASTKNRDPQDRIRLGTDLRFVNKARPWDERWNNHYKFNDGV